ncbi:ArsR/SmtB family transcription factor [Desertimonas flava]|uniref:ArsR/SmtB family transcription factor n=1 Tax=Desertimonas flava TaxID=2064846 RepID=UPI000E34AF84|nr:helix-turn-helix transcriptional regulator [Desertimonas flava]
MDGTGDAVDPADVADDRVFKALADPGRRALLDALFRTDGQSLGELCDVLPALTRFGVMKHLAVLAEAGLVVTYKAGRTKFHYLYPVPIREIHDRWTSKYAAVTTEALVGLRRHLEGDRTS